MPRNTLQDLQNHLFMEIERLNECEAGTEAMEAEIERAKAVSGVAEKAIDNANTVLRVMQFVGAGQSVPRMLTGGENGPENV